MEAKSSNTIPDIKAVKFHSIGRRIVAQFCIFTLVLSAIYGMFCFLLLYNLEDGFIEREVWKEANYLTGEYQITQQWPTPRNANMSLYFSKETLPDDMRQQFIDEPHRKEFYGTQGRHYHLLGLPGQQNVYLVAEVSEMLLVRPSRDGVLMLLMICGVCLVFVAFMIAWMLGRKTAKPLKQLADLVDGVAPENIPETFAHQFPNNEIGILARTLEHTMGRINQALEREKCFTRDVSHELRTPVAIIKNALEVYQVGHTGNNEGNSASAEGINNIFNRIGDASMQMEQTVTTLLALAREEQTAVEKESLALLPMVEQSIIDHSHLLEGKPVDVHLDDSCNTQVFAQQGMLKVLLDNLLSNAFQYTDSGEVSVSVIDGLLTIKDTGPGIEQGISEHVLEPRVKGSQSTGYGFGLSIVKRLCEHQGWLLNVASGKGTTISVSFG
ncbi:sensor histidine kinase [Thalassomonas actiniarum]|uniref:histidine kinase n=1 Tax=Thalassomonas actiniarum TaxID=485447 RepID=A0AAE9YL54_9GAMM|nr:HAMP domain-containing sensor histidine kinase [Thalassomonas actiniarum]WDD96748.1 HAMP domain-containing histidine kinase [Thalassomonas actiniarum]